MIRALTPPVVAIAFFALASTAVGTVPKRLVLGRVHVSPMRPAAGVAFRLQAAVYRSRRATGVLARGSVTCVGTVGRRPLLVHRGRFVRRLATCRWRFARSARGKPFRGTIFVRSRRATAHAFVSVRLR